MNPNTVIHIGTMHVHAPTPGVLLQSEGFLEKASGCCREALRGVFVTDDIVLDEARCLMWSKATTSRIKTWAEAKVAAKSVRLDGYTDWRLPTRAELLTLVDDTRTLPAIDTSRFDCDNSWYWTSTPAASLSCFAWVVNFDDGDTRLCRHNLAGCVRAVRSVSPAVSGQYRPVG